MRYLALLTITLAVPLSAAWADDDDEATLRHLKTVLWPQAYRTQDVELLDRLLHDTFQKIGRDGARSSKQEEIDALRAEAWNPGSFEYRIERLDIYDGRFAVVAGVGVALRYSYVSSNYLVKEDGRWQAIGSHVSGYERTDTGDDPE